MMGVMLVWFSRVYVVDEQAQANGSFYRLIEFVHTVFSLLLNKLAQKLSAIPIFSPALCCLLYE